jgi:copper chaperone CopZ
MKRLTLLVALLASPALADTIEMKVYGLVCSFCAQGIEKTLRKDPATAEVLVSLAHQTVAVVTHAGRDIPDEQLRRALTDAGYDVKAITRSRRSLAEIRSGFADAKP